MTDAKKPSKSKVINPNDEIMYSYTVDTTLLEEENRILKSTVESLNHELSKYREMPLLICTIKNVIDKNKAIIHLQNGNEFLVNVAKEVKNLKAGDTVVVEQKNLTVVDKTQSMKKFNVEQFVIVEKPTIEFNEVGGLDDEINEIKEVIELPLLKPELFKKMGINPPKGLLLYGPPGTGKTLLAKAVAKSTNSTFIQLVASELVQKFIGEGAKLVKEVFKLAREKSPTIIFIDEVDAIAGTRIELGTSGEREVQRTFMQLLGELDGFDPLDNVKIIACTNRKDILDPAMVRPGRLDRLIKVGHPKKEGRIEILKIHSRKMNLKDVDLINVAEKCEDMSGAQMKAICTEAGYFAIREDRDYVIHDDFVNAVDKVKNKESSEGDDYINMFN